MHDAYLHLFCTPKIFLHICTFFIFLYIHIFVIWCYVYAYACLMYMCSCHLCDSMPTVTQKILNKANELL